MKFKNGPELRKYLIERFGLTLPQGVQLTKTKGHGIRVHIKGLRTDRVFGLRGFMAYSNKSGLNFCFMQLFGHLARKNVIALKESEARRYASGEQIKKSLDIGKGLIILVHKGHVLGHGAYDGKGSISCPLREKRRRSINNSIMPWPGRNI